MLAAQYVAGRGIEVAEVDAPPPGPGEVQLEVAYVGICGTDLHILHGHMDDRVADHGGDRPRDVRDVSRRWATGVSGLGGRRPGHRDAAALVRPLPHVPGRPLSTSATAWTSSASTPPGSMQQLWNVPAGAPGAAAGRACRCARPPWSSRSRWPHHDVDARRCRRGERVLVVGGGPVGLLIAVVGARPGRRRRSWSSPTPSGARSRRSSASPPSTPARRTCRGADRRLVRGRRRGRRLRGVRHPAGPRPGDGALSAPRPARRRRHPRRAAPGRPEAGLLAELELVGARVYERTDFDGRRRAAGRKARSRWMRSCHRRAAAGDGARGVRGLAARRPGHEGARRLPSGGTA